MRTLMFTGVMALMFSTVANGQVGISTDGSNPHPSAMLEVKSTSKGILPPRLTTTERNAIAEPAEGLLIFNSTTGCIDYYLGGSWKSLGGVSEPVFQCGMKMTDARDGRKYNTVKINAQCWMAQNLNIGTRINGTAPMSNENVIEKYCYNDQESYCAVYGGLYQWGEVAGYLNGTSNYTTWNPLPIGDIQGICPDGWHIPSLEEWMELIDYAGGSSLAGGFMKEAGLSHWNLPNAGASNSTGYTALPAGKRDASGTFMENGQISYFWSSSETSTTGSWSWFIDNNYEFISGFNEYKVNGLSVRCVMDGASQ